MSQNKLLSKCSQGAAGAAGGIAPLDAELAGTAVNTDAKVAAELNATRAALNEVLTALNAFGILQDPPD